MHITISRHAAERALERGINEEGIRAIVDGTYHPFVTVPSKRDPKADTILGIYKGNVWAVLINKRSFNVITVRRAHKDEEKIYYDRRRTRRIL